MQYVYICRDGENEELRYSIRSVEKNAQRSEVLIFGQAPSWYDGQLIKVDRKGSKYSNARANLAQITKSGIVQDGFVLMNDDFYIMDKLEYPEIWHGGPLRQKIEVRKKLQPNASYTNLLIETYKSLQKLGIKDPLDYELHTPLFMTKEGLKEAMQYPGLWRSIYGNLNMINGEYHEDVKVYADHLKSLEQDISVGLYLSSDDQSFEGVRSLYLDKLFAKPSSYEVN